PRGHGGEPREPAGFRRRRLPALDLGGEEGAGIVDAAGAQRGGGLAALGRGVADRAGRGRGGGAGDGRVRVVEEVRRTNERPEGAGQKMTRTEAYHKF